MPKVFFSTVEKLSFSVSSIHPWQNLVKCLRKVVKYRKKTNYTIMAQYTKEQYWNIYEKLPQELKEALGSLEVQDEIDQICRENGITDEAVIDQVYNLVMDIFMGLVPPNSFEQGLNKLVQNKNSGEIAHRVQRFVIFPLKAELIQIHKMGEQSIGGGVSQSEQDSYMAKEEAQEQPEEEWVEEPKPEQSDKYRESVG